MSDLVERLRHEGSDAFIRHYSLGMWKLCAEAADEIERLKAELGQVREILNDREAEIERLTSDKAAISQTASDYLHELERLKDRIDEHHRMFEPMRAEIERLQREATKIANERAALAFENEQLKARLKALGEK